MRRGGWDERRGVDERRHEDLRTERMGWEEEMNQEVYDIQSYIDRSLLHAIFFKH